MEPRKAVHENGAREPVVKFGVIRISCLDRDINRCQFALDNGFDQSDNIIRLYKDFERTDSQ